MNSHAVPPALRVRGAWAVVPVRAFPVVAQILDEYSAPLGRDRMAYENHVGRGLNFFLALSDLPSPPLAVQVAAAFHDLGIWTHATFDYLPPSLALAECWLNREGLSALQPEVRVLIREHHKLRPYTGPHADTVECFRQADLIDLSLGRIRFGLPRECIRAVRAAFPNAGFHRRLAQLMLRQLARTPWRPLPMLRW